MKEDKIRIGLLLDGDELPLWAYQMLERILEAGHSEVVLRVIRQQEQQKPAPKGLVKKMLADPKHALFMLYRKFDRRNYKARQNAFESRNLSDLIQTDQLKVTPKSTRLSDRIEPEDLEKIKKYNIDLFIRFGFKILRGEILTMAPYGVWSYHHGDNRVHRGSVGAAWEVVQGWGETGATLQILTEDLDGGTLLGRSTIMTAKRYAENRNQLYWTASALLPQKLNELVRLGGEEFMKRLKAQNSTPEFYNNQLYRKPNNRVMLPVIRKRIWSKIRHKINKRRYFKQWILLYAFSRKEGLSRSFFRFKRLLPPKDRIWADPFVYQKGDTYYLFVEELLINKPKKGYIAVMEMDKKGNVGESKKIIETDYHLSYPFLWKENDELYMIPESSQNRTIDLYRCESFPDKWVHHKTLMEDIEAVDSTVIRRDGKYWLFANVKEFPDASTHDKLFLFSTDNLLEGDWTPHPMNPIVTEVRYARPAGNIFEYGGKLYRPAQNNAGHYGAGMQIQEITELSEEFYKEVNVQSIYPNWDKELFSTHTINSVGKLTVIDAQIMRKR